LGDDAIRSLSFDNELKRLTTTNKLTASEQENVVKQTHGFEKIAFDLRLSGCTRAIAIIRARVGRSVARRRADQRQCFAWRRES